MSVAFWGDICAHLKQWPEIARVYIPDFPGSMAVDTHEAALATHSLLQALIATLGQGAQGKLHGSLSGKQLQPDAKGDEVDAAVVAKLDLARDMLREGRINDAKKLLGDLGDPSVLRDQYSQFRFYTNSVAILLLLGIAQALGIALHARHVHRAQADRMCAALRSLGCIAAHADGREALPFAVDDY